MIHSINNIYQLKIEIVGSEPLIWRRILVENNRTFEELHAIFQIVLDWDDYAFYDIEIDGHLIREADETLIFGDFGSLPPNKIELSEILNMSIKTFNYYHDSLNSWKHVVYIEEMLTKTENTKYPLCIGGERKCPPEDMEDFEEFNQFIENRKKGLDPIPIEKKEGDILSFNPDEFDMRTINHDLQFIEDFLNLNPYNKT